MTTTSAAVGRPGRTVRVTGERAFFTGMSLAIAGVVVFGFGPTFFWRGGALPALATVTVWHGLAFTGWTVAYVLQSTLVTVGRRALHMRLGLLFMGLGALVSVLGVVTAVDAARRGAGAPPGLDPRAFMVIPFFDILLFAGFLAAGYIWRRSPGAHKRLMLLAMIDMMGPAMARVAQRSGQPLFAAHFPLWAFAGMMTFVAAGCVYDVVSGRRLHPAYLWGAVVLTASGPARFALSDTQAWLAFVDLLVRWI